MRPVRVLSVAALALAACGDDVGLPDARPEIDAPPAGRMSFAWTITHEGTPLTCAQLAASQVTIGIVPDNQPFGDVETFACGNAMGTSEDFPPGLYNITASLTGGGTLDELGPFFDVEVKPNETTAVPVFAFDVLPTGSLTFRVTSPPTGGNCAAAAAMGAGITEMIVELRDGAGACVPTTFAIAAGATAPARTYAADCSGAPTPCIDADQELRADGVTPGQHSMAMVGRVGTAPCWTRTTAFTTRAAGTVTALAPQQLALDPLVPGCPMP